jgi:hypothetical protein
MNLQRNELVLSPIEVVMKKCWILGSRHLEVDRRHITDETAVG